ncbi:alpha/beta hydrolase [Thiomicrorhabdus sp.]|uniref:alpha/beta hydrolase n=1 Tax=Thiomicrorhabdus sp. TaxID=2039724 RepID=UPI002AA72D5A|nr:alpha/beta hydrolase [Thiomicrorhabdus sp.]
MLYLILLCILLPILLLVGFIVAIHLSFRAPRFSNEVKPSDYSLNADTFEFKGNQATQLSAWWIPSNQPSDTTVLLMHGWGANKSLMLPLAKPFHDSGYNLLIMDAHNHGDSQKRGVSTMPKFAEDIQSGADWLKQNKPNKSRQLILVGHSVGAAATLLAAAKGLKANMFVAIASFVHPKLMMQRHLKKLDVIPGLVKLISNYVQWVIGHKFDDIAPSTSVTNITQPTLLVHGDADKVIPLSDHHMLCNVAPKEHIECLEIPDADHDSIDKIEQHFSSLNRFITKHLKPSKTQV